MRNLVLLVSIVFMAIFSFGQVTPPDFPPDADFNNDGVVNDQDLVDFDAVFSEGDCSTGDCDSIDINRDGSIFDPDDSDAYRLRLYEGLPVAMPWSPKIGPDNRIIIPAAERTVYVSSSIGDDSNSGFSEVQPVKTIARGYSLLRNNRGDHIRFKRGDTWSDERLTNPDGGWSKGGASSDRPMVITAYGEGPRPKFTKPHPGGTFRLQGDEGNGNVWLIGLEFAPDMTRADGKTAAGVSVYRSTIGFVIEDCRFVGGNSLGNFDGVVEGGLQNVVIRHCEVVDTRSYNGGHSGGLYVVKVEGMLLEYNVFRNIGLSEYEPGEVVPGGEAIVGHVVIVDQNRRDETEAKFCQGVYVVATPGTFARLPFVARFNTFDRVGHCALQMRAGLTYAYRNVVRRCAIGISGGHEMQPPGVLWKGAIARNEFSDFEPCPGGAQGDYIWASRGGGASIFGNVFKFPRTPGSPIYWETPRGSISDLGNTVLFQN